jgi:hypothetical protein
MDAVQVLERRYLPLLKWIAAELRDQHPTFQINAGAGPIGSPPGSTAYHAYVDAERPGTNDLEPNGVTLYVEVTGLPGTPTLCNLDVGWGADGVPPMDGLDLLPEGVIFGTDAVRLIDDALPTLQAHLDRCLRAWEAAYPRST